MILNNNVICNLHNYINKVAHRFNVRVNLVGVACYSQRNFLNIHVLILHLTLNPNANINLTSGLPNSKIIIGYYPLYFENTGIAFPAIH